MKGIFILLNAVLLVLIAVCMAGPERIGKGALSRMYHLFLLGWFQFDLAAAYLMKGLKNLFSHVYKGYRYPDAMAETVASKRRRIAQHRQMMKESSEGYRKKEHYSRKIPG